MMSISWLIWICAVLASGACSSGSERVTEWSSEPVAEFDASLLSSFTLNDRSEVVSWRGGASASASASARRQWSFISPGPTHPLSHSRTSSLTHSVPHSLRPVLVPSERVGGRPHVLFSGKQFLVLNSSASSPAAAVYLDTIVDDAGTGHSAGPGSGSTIAFVIKNEGIKSHTILGTTGPSPANAQIRLSGKKSLSINLPSTSRFSILDSSTAFHAYVIRSGKGEIELYQDGLLIDTKRIQGRQYGKENSKMNCLGCWFSKNYLQGRLSYLSFYTHAVSSTTLQELHAKLREVALQSNDGMIISDQTMSKSNQNSLIKPTSTSSSYLRAPKLMDADLQNPAAPVSVVREINGSIVISTHPIEEMLHKTNGTYVVSNDTIHAAVKGMLVVGCCVMIPWCILLICCLQRIFTCWTSPESSYSRVSTIPGARSSSSNQQQNSGSWQRRSHHTSAHHQNSRRRQKHGIESAHNTLTR